MWCNLARALKSLLKAGAGVGYLSSSEANVAGFTKHFGMATIGSDKINQLRHVRFLKDLYGVRQHMKKHAAIINPKFAAVATSLATHIKDTGMGQWSNPEGGYFVSFDTLPGLAKTVVNFSPAAEAGVKLTPAGATFPNGNDPQDCNIRLAPTFPELEDVETVNHGCNVVCQLRAIGIHSADYYLINIA